jgi:hypothetical protein
MTKQARRDAQPTAGPDDARVEVEPIVPREVTSENFEEYLFEMFYLRIPMAPREAARQRLAAQARREGGE